MAIYFEETVPYDAKLGDKIFCRLDIDVYDVGSIASASVEADKNFFINFNHGSGDFHRDRVSLYLRKTLSDGHEVIDIVRGRMDGIGEYDSVLFPQFDTIRDLIRFVRLMFQVWAENRYHLCTKHTYDILSNPGNIRIDIGRNEEIFFIDDNELKRVKVQTSSYRQYLVCQDSGTTLDILNKALVKSGKPRLSKMPKSKFKSIFGENVELEEGALKFKDMGAIKMFFSDFGALIKEDTTHHTIYSECYDESSDDDPFHSVVMEEPSPQEIIPQKQQPEQETKMSNLVATAVDTNKSAMKLAAELEMGRIANKAATAMILPHLPMMAQIALKGPQADLVVANLAMLATNQFRPGDARLKKLSAVMQAAAYQELLSQIPIEKMLTDLIEKITEEGFSWEALGVEEK